MRLLGQSLITLVLSFLLFSNVYSQSVPYTGNNSYSLCSGVITDHGGGGNYADNANGYSVINPSIVGNLVQLTGTFSTESCCDYVRIFDGVGTGGTVLYTGFGTGNIGTITSTSGSLTVQFYSDYSIVSSGFSFNIACLTPCTPPANPGFGINLWNVLGYNHAGYNFANLAALTGQTFRGYYTDATVDINSQARWNSNDSPSSATPYTGCPVTFDNHTVVYKRQGFPVAQYQIDLNGHDDGVQCYVNGVLVYQIDGCCADRGVIWTGALCSTSTVEFRVMEGGGGSNLAVDFIETPWTVNAGTDGTTVCAMALNGTSSSPTFVWSPTATLSSASVLNPIATPAATTTYTLSSTLNGCTISDDVIITKNPFTITGTSSSCIGATTDLNAPETEWVALPTGGTVTTIGNERIHRFTASGTFNTSQAISNARVLVVAGGGGGGHRHAGGGGAGGVLSNNSMTISSGAIAATIGNGGNGATAGVYGLNGGNSIFNGLTAIGGGYGSSNGQVAGIGGSGGGGSNNLLGQLGTAGQGNRGGNQGCSASYTVSGCGGACGGCYPYGSGGGGAGAQGGDSPGAGSAGGIGISNNITGAAVFYGGGGGGGLDGVIAAGLGYAGGNGGGGAGGSNATLQGVNGTANTGGGGGGGGASGGASGNGGNGGSGVVIVRYAIPSWTSSVPGVATVNPLSGVVTAVSAGTTVITYTSPSGCSTTFNFTVNSVSTAPTITPIPGTICPNTNTTLTATGGTAGTGSTINWYTGPNGTGSFLGSGGSVTVAPTSSTTYYARREGTCNTTSDASVTVNVKSFVYALNGTTSNTYCTDNAGWQHFYTGDEIIFSVQGDLTGAPIGFPLATILDNGVYYQQTEGPGTAPGCTSNQNPNEERFEMERSWNLDFGGGSQTGTYNIRFYYQPAERSAIETAAANWMATYPDCGYGYKYPNPLGFYWFKNSGSNYTAPDYDGTHYTATVASVSGVNYAQWTGIPNFSGGSGAVILEPITTLPVELNSFAVICNESGDEVTVRWSTNSEHNSSHFTVERSFDGNGWEVVGTVNAAGNSTSNLNYELTDSDARGHAVIYYRLNQLDLDGVSKVYGPTSAECLNDQLGFEVFPNPAGTDVTVLLHGEHQTGETEIVFTDLNGKEVKRIIYNEQTGKMMSVDLKNLEPGVYLVRLITGDTNNQFVRLIKQ